HDVRKLVSWLLEPNGNWTPQIVDATIASGERIDVSLSVPTPIYMTYITAWGTPDGIVHFRPDVYNRDAAGDLALSGQDS
ncbi:MAG: murein L,D-transpeptidase, partial [Rhodobiaceae bacterium]|nr:murein L,D-transpeptidase [Rhodobiaceae bacterium]